MTREQLAATGTKTAFEFAERAVTDTQGIYNKGNRMNVGRGALWRHNDDVQTVQHHVPGASEAPAAQQQLMMLGIMALAAGADSRSSRTSRTSSTPSASGSDSARTASDGAQRTVWRNVSASR